MNNLERGETIKQFGDLPELTLCVHGNTGQWNKARGSYFVDGMWPRICECRTDDFPTPVEVAQAWKK